MRTWIAQSRRLMAVVLLLWGLCDLTVPGLCQSDLPNAVETSASASPAAAVAHAAVSKNHKNTPQQTNAAFDQDDCWCCCGHVVPATMAFDYYSEAHESTDSPASPRAPHWTARELFQPPKA